MIKQMANISSIDLLIKSEDTGYQSVLLNPKENTVYLGTQQGCIEIWSITPLEKVAELRYLELDDFGEPMILDDPVVSIAATKDFDLIYGFMGNAAYCIDPHLRVIVQQIPISEPVVSGNICQETGIIGVITKPGYLSIWSPKFYERIASHEFLFDTKSAYLLFEEPHRIILILKDDQVMTVNFGDEKYLLKNTSNQISKAIDTHWFDLNDQYLCYVQRDTDQPAVRILSNTRKNRKRFFSKHPEIELFQEGKNKAEVDLRTQVKSKEENAEKEMLPDFRLLRKSHDRYTAEVEAVRYSREQPREEIRRVVRQTDLEKTASLKEDSRSLKFAFRDLESDNYETQSMALEIITGISKRHNISGRFVYIAWDLHHREPTTVLDFARYYQEEDRKRRNRIRTSFQVMAGLFVLFLIFLQVSFSYNTDLVVYALAIVILATSVFISMINQRPKIRGISDFKGVRWLIVLTVLVSIGYLNWSAIRGLFS